MVDIVSHVPIGPRPLKPEGDNKKVAPPGYMVFPVFGNHVAKFHTQNGRPTKYISMLDGLKPDQPEIYLRQTTDLLNIETDRVLIQSGNIETHIEPFMHNLWRQNKIRVEETEKYICPCGKCEFHSEGIDSLTYSEGVADDGVCTICEGALQTVTSPSLLYYPGVNRYVYEDVSQGAFFVPNWRKEFEDQLEHMIKHPLLISRSTKREYSLRVDGAEFNLDNDLLNMFSLSLLRAEDYNVTDFLVGHRQMRLVVLMHLLHHDLFDIFNGNLVVAPTIKFSSSKTHESMGSLEEFDFNDSSLVKAFKLLLISGLATKRKEISVDTIKLPRIASRIKDVGNGRKENNDVKDYYPSPYELLELVLKLSSRKQKKLSLKDVNLLNSI